MQPCRPCRVLHLVLHLHLHQLHHSTTGFPAGGGYEPNNSTGVDIVVAIKPDKLHFPARASLRKRHST